MKTCLLALNLVSAVKMPTNWYYCEEINKISLEITALANRADSTIIVNDKHPPNDPEFRFLPPHGIINDYKSFPLIDLIAKLPRSQILSKVTLDPLRTCHNEQIILPNDEFWLCGFHLHTDIIPACLSLLDRGKKVVVWKNACGDISIDLKKRALDYLTVLGIEIR